MKKFKSTIPIIAMTLISLIIIGVLVVLSGTTRTFISDLLFKQAKTSNDSFAYSFAQYQDEALQRAQLIAGSAEIVEAIENDDHDALVEALNNFSVGLDLITLCDSEGIVLARTHSDKTGDSVINQKAISTALNTGTGIKTIEQGTVIGLSTRGSAAIKDDQGNTIGALTCGHDLSLSKYIDAVKTQNNCEATFFAGTERMSTTLFNEKGERALGTSANDDVIETVINNKSEYTGRVELFGNTYQVHYSPVLVDNQAIGMLFTGVNINAALQEERMILYLIGLTVVMLVLAVLITVFLIRSSSKKAHWYESMLDCIPFPLSVTDNDMNWTFINKPVEQMLNVKRSDVIGKPCSNWGAGICKTDNCGVNCLKKGMNTTYFDQAGMDFRVDISYLYDMRGKKDGHIEIVQDITEMKAVQKAQDILVNRIDEVADAFVEGSKQMADGASLLAQGSAEQAASIEELSGSISEITDKTKHNANMANKAAKLAETIKGNAQKGSHQMDEMMSAVKEINQASQSINNVIKVIDDIAFQTNILALNAAVEAARAGQYGKGFAVVAEEVRNLAAKSADAAKDTGALIVNSIEKAELGARIADETAASLIDIVSGINESSQLVEEIAKSSEEQSLGIAQVNKGIEQVANVVSQNSATAEQSAAASSQMSDQAAVLSALLDQYKKKE